MHAHHGFHAIDFLHFRSSDSPNRTDQVGHRRLSLPHVARSIEETAPIGLRPRHVSLDTSDGGLILSACVSFNVEQNAAGSSMPKAPVIHEPIPHVYRALSADLLDYCMHGGTGRGHRQDGSMVPLDAEYSTQNNVFRVDSPGGRLLRLQMASKWSLSPG